MIVRLLLCCLLLCACRATMPPVSDRVLRLNLSHEPTTLDPRKGGDLASSHLHFLLFEGLMRLNPDGSLSLAQAESYEKLDGGKSYRFRLRETYWSNGLPVVAADFEKAWKTILDPLFPSSNAHLLYPIKNAQAAKQGTVPLSDVGVIAEDPKTLLVVLEKPTPYFLELVSFCVLFPICSQIDVEHPDWSYHSGPYFVSNGPFILKEWKHQDQLIVIKNSCYWDTAALRPDTLYFSMIGDPMTALQLFEAGQLDMLGDPISPLPVEALPSLQHQGVLRTCAIGATSLITFNTEHPLLHHPAIRQAFSYALDRESLVSNILHSQSMPALHLVPPALKQDRSTPFFKDGDVARARLLMEEGMQQLGVGRDAFSQLTYCYPLSERNRQLAEALQQQWQQVLGVHVAIEGCEPKVLLDKLSHRNYHFAQSLCAAQYHDPMNMLERFSTKANVKNYPQWEDREFVELIEASFYCEGRARWECLDAAEARLIEQMPVCPLYHWEMTYIVQPRLLDKEHPVAGQLVFNVLGLS